MFNISWCGGYTKNLPVKIMWLRYDGSSYSLIVRCFELVAFVRDGLEVENLIRNRTIKATAYILQQVRLEIVPQGRNLKRVCTIYQIPCSHDLIRYDEFVSCWISRAIKYCQSQWKLIDRREVSMTLIEQNQPDIVYFYVNIQLSMGIDPCDAGQSIIVVKDWKYGKNH